MRLSLQQLSERAGVPGRTVRYYIQKGLLPPPQGQRRGAWYSDAHLADLLRIREWQDIGLSLDAIADLLAGKRGAPVEQPRPGSVQVRSHLIVADGVELVVSPEQAGLSQAQLRELFRAVREACAELRDSDIPHQPD